MSQPGILLRHLAFTGSGLQAASLGFGESLSIVYGASNTGKSFVLKALNFMLGGSDPLPEIEQRNGYDKVWLGMTLPNGDDVTLYRAAHGGAFLAYQGLIQEKPSTPGLVLAAKHVARSDANLSRYLLKSLGIGDKEIVKNANGQKEALTFRGLARYVFSEESAIFDERSPVVSGQVIKATVEKNIFRFLLTGRDDAAVAATTSATVETAMMRGKTDLVDELIATINDELSGTPALEAVVAQLDRLNVSINSLHGILSARQETLDALVNQRRLVADQVADTIARSEELGLVLVRFSKLDEVYRSDVERLAGLEEASFLLKVKAGRPCPLCGAPPEHGIHGHDALEIERAHQAALIEIQKIQAERRDLQGTVASLNAEAEGLRKRINELHLERKRLDSEIESLRPSEARSRAEHEELLSARNAVQHSLELFRQREQLEARRGRLSAPLPRRVKGTSLSVGIDGATAHQFAVTVQGVLDTWRFPGDPVVSFDPTTHDIRINGKERAANGKGVRALLHAAFKIGVLVFCRENGLPHPGFIVLDTPLLTYREPLKNPKHGPLAKDEEEFQKTALNEHFYRYLATLDGQVLILENVDPPLSAIKGATVTAFTGQPNAGRFGFFPLRPPGTPPPKRTGRRSSGTAKRVSSLAQDG